MAARGTGTSKASAAEATALKTKASLLAWAKVESRTEKELAAVCGKHVEVYRIIASHPRAAADHIESFLAAAELTAIEGKAVARVISNRVDAAK